MSMNNLNGGLTIKHNLKTIPKADRLMSHFGARVDARGVLEEWKEKAKVAHVSVKRKSIASALAEFKKLNDVKEFYTSFPTPSANYSDDSIVVWYTTKS